MENGGGATRAPPQWITSSPMRWITFRAMLTGRNVDGLSRNWALSGARADPSPAAAPWRERRREQELDWRGKALRRLRWQMWSTDHCDLHSTALQRTDRSRLSRRRLRDSRVGGTRSR